MVSYPHPWDQCLPVYYTSLPNAFSLHLPSRGLSHPCTHACGSKDPSPPVLPPQGTFSYLSYHRPRQAGHPQVLLTGTSSSLLSALLPALG